MSKSMTKFKRTNARSLAKKKENEFRETLITEIFLRPCLWDKRNKDCKNREFVETNWKEIGSVVNLPIDETKKYWKSLKDRFRSICQGILQKKSATEFRDIDKHANEVKWRFFKSLLFLKDVIGPRETSFTREDGSEQSAGDRKEFLFCNINEPAIDIEPGPHSEFRQTISEGNIFPSSSPLPSSSTSSGFDSPALNNFQMKRKRRYPEHSILVELAKINSELTTCQDPNDDATRFGLHLAGVLRRVPQNLRLECEFQVMQLAYSFAAGVYTPSKLFRNDNRMNGEEL